MASLDFVGKEQAKQIAENDSVGSIIYVAEQSYRHSCGDNKIIDGDNLRALHLLLQDYNSKIDLIYIDPPYNTGVKNWVFNDAMSDSDSIRWLKKNFGVLVREMDTHDKWLCMMMPRLILMRELLAEQGLIMISIDDVEMARLKLLVDEIFGENNYLATLVWDSPGVKEASELIDASGEHEYVIVYAKDINSFRESRNRTEVQGFGWRKNTGQSSVIGKDVFTVDGQNDLKNALREAEFNYPKPVRLLKELIKGITSKDALILDCFAGSGTLGQAIIELNREDQGEIQHGPGKEQRDVELYQRD